ncbi:MAG TPA: hypothetical protein PLU65_10225, partial [Dokdonella sp.]|nr:hypothetical protein [Dokdonella sp.]
MNPCIRPVDAGWVAPEAGADHIGCVSIAPSVESAGSSPGRCDDDAAVGTALSWMAGRGLQFGQSVHQCIVQQRFAPAFERGWP